MTHAPFNVLFSALIVSLARRVEAIGRMRPDAAEEQAS